VSCFKSLTDRAPVVGKGQIWSFSPCIVVVLCIDLPVEFSLLSTTRSSLDLASNHSPTMRRTPLAPMNGRIRAAH
jgi:hypothetical protein